ncbi:MAG: GGDEF domain-containing protein [Leptolinea sp.]|nr:GGDEF domain-containing protein [Leptolinea sp.]
MTQVLINLTMGLALWIATRGRYQYGLNYFIGLFFSQAFAQTLYIFRGILPDFITVVVANVLVVASYNLGYLGYCHFFDREPNLWAMIIPVVIILVVFILYIDNFRVRVITLGFVSSAQFLFQFSLLYTTRANGVKRSKPILLSAYGMIIVLFTIRAAYMVDHPVGIRDLFDPMWLNSATLFTTILSIVLIALGVLLMLSERLLEENRELATRDYLTHIFNRRTFNDLARRELARAERNSHDTSLLMIDIDRFKFVNDTYGHPVGDEALVHLVSILKRAVRMQDLYARYGGEEFIILLAETSSEEAFQIAERLRERIADSSLVVHNHTINMTVSIGVATTGIVDKSTLEKLISDADTAMYAAKNAGRNCTRVFEPIPAKVNI